MAKKTKPIDYLEIPSVRMPTFGTGEVAGMLGTEIWRIQKFLDSPKYRLSPAGQLGSGRGSRRVFTSHDVYRLAVAEHLVKVGFSYKFVSEALQQMEDDDLIGRIDEMGEELDVLYALSGEEGNVRIRAINRDRPIGEIIKTTKKGSFYVLDLVGILGDVYGKMVG